MSAEQTPDIERVLAEHRINYHSRNVGGETSESLRYTSCEGCDWKGGWHDEAGWEAHVAQALAPVLAAAVREAEPGVRVGFRYLDGEVLSPEREALSGDDELPEVVLDLGDGEWLTLADLRADRVAEPQHEAATSGKESEASDE